MHHMPIKDQEKSDTISAGFGNDESESDENDCGKSSTHGLYEGGRSANEFNTGPFVSQMKDLSPTKVHEYTSP